MKILIGILSLFLVITIIPNVFADIPFDDYVEQIIKIQVGTNGNAHVIHEISPFNGSAKLEFLDGTHSNFDIVCKLSCPFEFDDTDQIFEESEYMVFKQFPAFQNSLIIEYDLENVLEFSNGLWKWEISSKAEPEIYFDDSIELIFINSTPIDISDIPGIHCKGGGCYMILEFFDPDEMNSTILFESDISIQSNDKISNFKSLFRYNSY